MYDEEEIMIKLGDLTSTPFQTQRGLKQGGVSSFILFLLVMDALL